jgi:hypothetical protein
MKPAGLPNTRSGVCNYHFKFCGTLGITRGELPDALGELTSLTD